MAYDADNKMTSFSDGMESGSYVYDGQGNRVQRVSSTKAGVTTYVYDAFGQLAAEYSMAAQGTDFTRKFRTTDHLGSTRLITLAGAAVDPAGGCRDFFPFGERIPGEMTGVRSDDCYKELDSIAQQFTAKERDGESGLDYFLARYSSAMIGRFTSPDPRMASARARSPQTWNRYSYVANNPLRFIDPDGQELVQLGQHTDEEIEKRKREIKQQLKNKDLTKDQKKSLRQERNTLAIEKAGNAVIGALLAKLDETGERDGLQLSDVTLSTNTKKDFKDFATPGALKQMRDDQAFVIQGNDRFSGTIYVRTEPEAGFYQASQLNSDFDYYGASSLSYEKVHLDGGGEPPAYARRLRVLKGFKSLFQNPSFYEVFLQTIQDGIDAHKPQQ